MSIVELFNKKFNNNSGIDCDFSLLKYTDNVFVGRDKSGNCAMVINSSTPNHNQIMQKTKMLSLECNVSVTYNLDGKTITSTVHVLKCYSKEADEISLFLELSILFILKGDYSEQHLLNVFRTMVNFFSIKNEPSEIELQGLFAELYAIKYFQSSLDLGKYWQSRDKLKFDFSISDTLKIEVKSTIKPERIHHFKHEQLTTNLYDIYIISFILRYDDSGISLFDLLIEMKNYYKNDPEHLIKILKTLRSTSKSRLISMKFEKNYIESKMKIFKAKDVPKFKQKTPSGVFNAEYDCSLENINEISLTEFINNIKSINAQNCI